MAPPLPNCEWCEEGLEESLDGPLRCGICSGSEPTNERLCASCQRFGRSSHVLYCDDPSWPGLEQDGLLQFVEFAQDLGVDEAPAWESMPRQPLDQSSALMSCIMCKLVSELLQSDLEGCEPEAQISLWRPFPTSQTSKQWATQENAHKGQFVLPVILFKSRDASHPIVFLLELILQYQEHRLVEVTVWDRSLIETTPIKEWLKECTEQAGEVHQAHERCVQNSQVHSRSSQSFRVIDTSARCLVTYEHLEDRPEYAALSYAWASVSNTSLHLTRDTFNILFEPGAIGGQNLFVDAIDLCLSISQRYLWIDKLCIIQDDRIDKTSQIEEMGAIYHLATLTIVALTETNRGLPGASTRNPRQSKSVYSPSTAYWQLQPTNFVNESTGQALPPFLNTLVDHSIWESRGWTCQEKRLSRRLLFVTDQHVYPCCAGVFSEYRRNNVSSYRNYRIRSGNSFILAGNAFERSLGLGRRLAPFTSYAYAVGDYSKRELTFWTDKLDAFSGFGYLLGVANLFLGLPRRFFSRALLWNPVEPRNAQGLERHWQATSSAFPSWSWVSTRGGVSYSLANEVFRPQDMGHLVIFYTNAPRLRIKGDSESTLQPINNELFWFDETVLNEKTDDEKANHYTEILHRHLPSSIDSWKMCIHSPWEAIKHYDVSPSTYEVVGRLADTVPGALIFNTTCAELRLSSRLMPDARTDMDCVQVNIIDTHGVVVGCVYPPMPDLETATKAYSGLNRDDHYYTIIVVGASLFMHWPQAPQGTKKPSYSGLYVLVTRREESGLLKRVAMGMVRQSEWNGTGAKWETMILG